MYVFNVHVVDAYVVSYDGIHPHKIQSQHERRQKGNYIEACLEILQNFMPLVLSVNRAMGEETKSETKQLSAALSTK